MALRDLKITVVKAEGCSSTKPGATCHVRNGRLELPPGGSVCLFALGSLMMPLAGAMMKTAPGEGMLDFRQDWQCPDAQAKVIYRIEPA